MQAQEMGTTGLIEWIWAAKTFRSRGQRKRLALAIITQRHGVRACELFKAALAQATVNLSEKTWAIK